MYQNLLKLIRQLRRKIEHADRVIITLLQYISLLKPIKDATAVQRPSLWIMTTGPNPPRGPYGLHIVCIVIVPNK
jgi:hypothetical protein